MEALLFLSAAIGGFYFALPTCLIVTIVRVWLGRRTPSANKSSSWMILWTSFCGCFITGMAFILIYSAFNPPRRL